MSVYEEKINLLEKIIVAEKVKTQNARGLATIATLVYEYGAGDAYAGLMLDKLCSDGARQVALRNFCSKARGKEVRGRIDWVELNQAFDALSKKYKIFRLLDQMAVSGGRVDKIKDYAKELGVIG